LRIFSFSFYLKKKIYSIFSIFYSVRSILFSSYLVFVCNIILVLVLVPIHEKAIILSSFSFMKITRYYVARMRDMGNRSAGKKYLKELRKCWGFHNDWRVVTWCKIFWNYLFLELDIILRTAVRIFYRT